MQVKTTALQQFKYILLTTRYEKQQVENSKKSVSLKFCHVICFVVRACHALDVFKGLFDSGGLAGAQGDSPNLNP